MSSETAQLKEDTENRETTSSVKRSVLSKLYKEKRKNAVNEGQQDNQSESTFLGRLINTGVAFLKPKTVLDKQKIVGVQTIPKMDIDSIEEGTQFSQSEIRKLRFELSNGDKTDWYEWTTDESELDEIIAYYANGDFSELLRGKPVLYDAESDSTIRTPNRSQSRSSRLALNMSCRIEAAKKQYGTRKYKIFKTRESFLSASFLYGFIALHFSAGGLPFGLTILVTGLMLLAHFLLGMYFDETQEDYYSPIEHYSAPFQPLIQSLRFSKDVIQRGIKKIDKTR